jgi:ribonuclease J
MLEWLRPESFIPVHGTLHHLRNHAKLARETGVDDIVVVENGELVEVDRDGGLRRAGTIPSGSVRIAFGGQVLDQCTAHQRLELGRNGVVVVTLAIDAEGRRLAAPSARAEGVPGLEKGETLSFLLHELERALFSGKRSRRVDPEREARRVARRVVLEATGSKPIVLVQVVRP